MTIRYVAYTWLGQKVEGVLEVETEEAAHEVLRRDELIPYRLAPVRPRPSLAQLLPSLFRPPPREIIDFTRSLAALLRAGISVRQALVTLRDQTRSWGLKEALRQALQDIEGGSRFSEAFSRHPTVFPNFYVRLLKVGEAIGGIPLALEQLADSLEKSKGVRDKVRGALVYPAISLVVVGIAVFILVVYSLPALLELLEEFGGELPTATRVLVTLAGAMQAYRGYILASAAGAIALGWLYVRTERGAMTRDRLLLRMPVVGRVVIRSSLFSLTSTLGTLLRAGVPPVEALRLSAEGLNNRVLRETLAQIVADATAGMHLGRAFGRHTVFPPLLSQAITTGETTGDLPDTLQALAVYYEQETTRAVSGATELIQPAIILVVGGVVGFVATAVISGIYSTIGAIE